MKEPTKQERAAIEAVANRYSAAWEAGGARSDASLVIAGKRIAVDIATLKRHGKRQSSAARPQLRFDKVVTRLMDRLRANLGMAVPDGMGVALTITAPIRLPGKTAAALEERVAALLRRRSAGRDENATIHGNRVRVRLLSDVPEQTPKLIGFVHNPETDPLLLLDMTRDLLQVITAQAGRRAPQPAGDRWLVVISAGESSHLAAYRCVYSQLRAVAGYAKSLMVFGDGQIGILAG